MSELRQIPVEPWFQWSVGSVLGALSMHEQGLFYHTGLLCDYLLRDDRVFATRGTRIGGLTGLPFHIAPAPCGGRAEEAAEALRQDWPKMVSRDVLAELKGWSVMMGFGLGELCWHTSGERWIPEVRSWHPSHAWYYTNDWAYAVNTMDGVEYVQPGDGKWLLHKPHGYYRGWIHGAVRAIAILALLRQYCLRDAGRVGELYGLGVKKGKVPAQASKEDRALFKAQLARLASEGLILLPSYIDKKTGKETCFDFDFVGVDVGEGAARLFEVLAGRCDTGITLALLGQNLTTEVKEGSFAAARVHGDVRQDVLEGDALTLAEDLRAQLIRPWAAFNFGDPELAPILVWDTEPPEDLSSAADTLSKLADALEKFSSILPDIDRRALLHRFGVPLLPEQQKTDDAKSQIFQYHIASGVVTVNEVRASLGLPPQPDGDVPASLPSGGAAASLGDHVTASTLGRVRPRRLGRAA